MNFIPKDYVGVSTRVEQLHADHDKDISIDTTFTLQGDVACFKAVVKTKKGTFTGSSFGKLGREKAFEKLETVAVGRALAFAGYETTSGIASREEMEEFEANNAPQTHEAPKVYPKKPGQLELIEYIGKIKESSDSNEITALVSEAKGFYKSEKQVSWLDKEARERNKHLLARS